MQANQAVGLCRVGKISLKMKKLKLALMVWFIWLVATSAYAYYYIVSTLALPEEYDAYARNWEFQLLAFSLVRLPFLILILVVLIGVVVVLPPRKTSS